MVCFCFLVDQKSVVRRSKPVAGTCSRCRHGATVVDMKTLTRFCCIPFYCKSWKAIMCTFCGTILKSYRTTFILPPPALDQSKSSNGGSKRSSMDRVSHKLVFHFRLHRPIERAGAEVLTRAGAG